MDILAPVAGTFLYLSYPWNGKTFIIVHNLALQLFSMWICASLGYAIWSKEFRLESGYYMSDPQINQLMFYFYLSKYYEYMDTFILYAKGKQPIFLQKYHHVGAALCWHICWVNNVDSMVFATLLNSFIHSIMYSYYLGTLFKINLKAVKPYITYLQILQFFTGLYGGYLLYSIETPVNKICIIIAALYTIGNIILFGKFVQDNYMAPVKDA